MSNVPDPVVPDGHPLRPLADMLDEYASSESECLDDMVRELFAALGPARLFDLASIAFPLLPAAERNLFLRIALLVDHGLRRGTSEEGPIVDETPSLRDHGRCSTRN